MRVSSYRDQNSHVHATVRKFYVRFQALPTKHTPSEFALKVKPAELWQIKIWERHMDGVPINSRRANRL